MTRLESIKRTLIDMNKELCSKDPNDLISFYKQDVRVLLDVVDALNNAMRPNSSRWPVDCWDYPREWRRLKQAILKLDEEE